MAEGFLARYREAMAEYRKDREGGKESKRGKNTHVEMQATRHGIPFKDPKTGMSMDKITDPGLAKIRQAGQEENTPYVLVTGSRAVNRARETGQAYLQGVNENEITEVINKEGTAGSKLNEFGIYAMSDLDPSAGAGKILTPILAEGKALVEAGQLDKSQLESWAIQKYLETPEDEFKKADAETPHQSAALLAHRLLAGERMSKQLFEDLDIKVNNFTHGPKPDAFMMQMGLVKSMDEVGGCFKPGESFGIDFYRDEKGELVEPITLTFRGRKFNLDRNQFAALAEEGKVLSEAKRRERGKKKLEEK